MQQDNITVSDVLADDTKDFVKVYVTSDSDDEIATILKQSPYLTETELIDFFKTKKISDETHIKLLSLNIANLLSKLSSLKILIQNISTESNKPNLIALTPTLADLNAKDTLKMNYNSSYPAINSSIMIGLINEEVE